MTTSIETKPKRRLPSKRVVAAALGFAVLFGSFAIGSARADDDDWHRGHRDSHREVHREYRGNGGVTVYAPPPVVYAEPGYGYYPPPPVVYGYGPSIGFGINIH